MTDSGTVEITGTIECHFDLPAAPPETLEAIEGAILDGKTDAAIATLRRIMAEYSDHYLGGVVQTQLAYIFERKWISPLDDDQTLTKKECKTLALEALKLYGHNEGLYIEWPRGGDNAQGWVGGIMLPPWARKPTVILHEIAHMLQGVINARTLTWSDAHGDLWLGIYLDLIEWRFGIDAAMLADIAREEFGLEYARVERQLPAVQTYLSPAVLAIAPATEWDAAPGGSPFDNNDGEGVEQCES